jgi:hypothetical protein
MIIYFVFSAFISRPTSLLASRRVPVFSFMVFILSLQATNEDKSREGLSETKNSYK